MRKKIPYLLFMFCIILILLPQTAYAKEKDAEENDIYDSLQESIHKMGLQILKLQMKSK